MSLFSKGFYSGVVLLSTLNFNLHAEELTHLSSLPMASVHKPILTLADYKQKTTPAPSHNPVLAPAVSAATVNSSVPPPPQINAKAYILMDADTGLILAGKNIDNHMAPASLTKIMTLYIIAKTLNNHQIHLNDNVLISKTAWRTGGSRMFIDVGNQVSVNDLIQGISVVSGNDATVAMAEYLAGSEGSFAAIMNQEALGMGLKNSHFEDANGLPHPNHYSSARDFALLAKNFINNYPNEYQWFKQKDFTFNKITQQNRNRLMWQDPSVDGIKTGFTDDAGFCLVASAKRDNMRLISVILGAPKPSIRAEDSEKLLNYGFRFYKTYKFYPAHSTVAQARVWKGQHREVAMGATQPIAITIPSSVKKNLTAQVSLQPLVVAPVQKNNAYGTIAVLDNNKPVFTSPLVALQNDPLGGFWTRFKDGFLLTYHRIFSF